LIIGHEMAGEVVEIGKGVKTHSVGDYVSAETHIACGKCFQCKSGNMHICQNVKIFGVDINGCYAEYAVLPASNAWKNDKSLPPHLACAQEPLGNAIHTVFDNEIEGNVISIFGCGPIGLCAIQLCKNAGAKKVFAVDIHPYRLKMARQMGADVVLNAGEDDVVTEITKSSDRGGADVFLEMSGSPKAYEDGFKSLRHGGSVSLLGLPSKPVQLYFNDAIIFKGARVYGVNGRLMWKTWAKAKELLKNRAVDLSKIVTHRMKLTDFEKAIALMKSGECGKIALTP